MHAFCVFVWGFHADYCVCRFMSGSLVENPLRHRVLCGLYYITYTKEANGHWIRYSDGGSGEQTDRQAAEDAYGFVYVSGSRVTFHEPVLELKSFYKHVHKHHKFEDSLILLSLFCPPHFYQLPSTHNALQIFYATIKHNGCLASVWDVDFLPAVSFPKCRDYCSCRRSESFYVYDALRFCLCLLVRY